MKHRILSLLAILVLITSLNLFSEEDDIKISALVHLSGEYAEFGKAFREGIEISVAKINKAGGVLGRNLKPVFSDTQYNMKTVNTISQKAIHIDKTPLALIFKLHRGNGSRSSF